MNFITARDCDVGLYKKAIDKLLGGATSIAFVGLVSDLAADHPIWLADDNESQLMFDNQRERLLRGKK